MFSTNRLTILVWQKLHKMLQNVNFKRIFVGLGLAIVLLILFQIGVEEVLERSKIAIASLEEEAAEGLWTSGNSSNISIWSYKYHKDPCDLESISRQGFMGPKELTAEEITNRTHSLGEFLNNFKPQPYIPGTRGIVYSV
jgi:hypothetical protein